MNLFIPSRLSWKEKGITVVQHTLLPREENTELTIGTSHPETFTLRIRKPHWSGAVLAAGGRFYPQAGRPPRLSFNRGSHAIVAFPDRRFRVKGRRESTPVFIPREKLPTPRETPLKEMP